MDWKLGPPVIVGEKVFWSGNLQNEPQSATVKWIGKIPELSSDWSVGIEFDTPLHDGGSSGFWKDRKLFECQPKRGLIVNIQEVQKLQSRCNSKRTIVQSHLDLKVDDSRLGNFKHLDLENKPFEKNQRIITKSQYSDVESKLNEWSEKNRKSIGRSASVLNSTIRKQFNKKNKFEEALGSLKTKNQDEKSLRKVKRKRSTPHEPKRPPPRKLDSDRPYVQDATDYFINFTVNKAFEDPQKLSTKNMNEVVGYFKVIKEDGRVGGESHKQLDGYLPDANVPGQSKEKKFFSFLKWFKKNKDDPVLKNFTESSAASSPMSVRRTSSCESIDTLFSTQTVRSFAYIPPTQYLPSAPPSTLLDFDKSLEENVYKDPPEKEDVESIYDRKKKRKAPDPPRLSRENSLPSTLEHKKSDEEVTDGTKTYHRRTVSESFKDKKAGAYCHVQGKRKAPLPPPVQSIYPNLQKLNSQYSSLNKKKKPAPPPPDSKNGETYVPNVGEEKSNTKTEAFNSEKSGEKIVGEKGNNETDLGKEDKKRGNSNQIPKENPVKDVSLSPLPSRPWYKRSHRDSNGSNIIKKDFLKGFEKKRNKESEDWMPEVGFPRRSLSTDSSYNKFNIFSRLDKNEDKKKEEKRKSQISILTNISELDREAAEIVRKEQAEEKKMLAANDAKYYSSDSPSIHSNNRDHSEKIVNDNQVKGVPDSQISVTKTISSNKCGNENFNSPKSVSKIRAKEPVQELKIQHFQSPSEERRTNDTSKNERSSQRDEKSNIKSNVITNNKNTSQEDASNSSTSKSHTNVNSNGTYSASNYFKVENKELNYLNKSWICQKCTLENPGWRVFCEICSSVKPQFLINLEKKPESPLEKSSEVNSKTENKEAKAEAQLLSIEKRKNKESNLLSGEDLPVKIIQDKNNINEDQMKENVEEIRQKRMTFFTSKLDEQRESKLNNESTTSVPDSGKKDQKNILKEMKGSSPKKEPEQNSKEKCQEPNERLQGDDDTSFGDNLKRGQVKPSKSIPTSGNSKTNISFPIKSIPEYVEKCSAVKEKQLPQEKNEEIAEAYVVTKTIVLEDIIIKKGDKSSKLSASCQTKATRKSGTSSDNVVRPPPRTKKTFSDASVEVKSSELGYKPGPNKRKYERPLDLTIAENEFQSEGKKFEELEELTNRLTHAEGVADFRANIETMAPNTEMNTVAVNRLLRRLEGAINNGEHVVAAGLAKELALMKINCSVTRQIENSSPAPGSSKITIDLYVEDKVSHQGPIQIQVSPTMTLLQLKKKVQQELGIPMDVQRWILGKQLATDETKTLDSAGIVNDSCSVFLYLVAPGNRELETNTVLINSDKNPEVKSSRNSLGTEQKPSVEVKGKGWYYNYEEDHYSFCEDTEDESQDFSSSSNHENDENTSTTDPTTASTSKAFQNEELNSSSSQVPKEETKKPEKTSLFSLQTRESESDFDKEVKLIPVNSVKQKVEKLNKSLAEKNAPLKSNLKAKQSMLVHWKCIACSSLNAPGRLICSACSAKKGFSRSDRETPKADSGNHRKDWNDPKTTAKKSEAKIEENIHYQALIELQDADLVPNTEPFNCPVCLVDYTPGEGVTLKDCLHTFCRACLVNTVQFSEDAEVKCPYLDDTYSCTSVLQQREIKALVPKKLFELHLAKSVKEAENKIGNAFHCKTPDCKGWCIYEDNVNEFHCPVCKSVNCLTCQTIHTGVNCKQYQERMKDASETDVDAKKTRIMLEEMVEKGEAMACPKCQVVLMKKWGCDWLRCSMCKTEICWVTRGFRWGPEGKGDTSAGCKCGVNGIKCHPKCNYCH